MHCPDHPKYKGDRELKQKSRINCSGCQAVRKAFLAGTEKRKNKGKGSQFSITSPGFRCGVAHLMAEMGTVMLYGQQPAYFWRQGIKADPRAKRHFSKTYRLINVRFQQNPDLFRSLGQVLWLVWEDDYHKISRQKEHDQSVQLAINEAKPAQIEKPESVESHLSNVHLNPLLFDLEDEVNGEEEKENRSF